MKVRGASGLAVLLLGLTLAQAPLSKNPLLSKPMPWAEAILLPPTSALVSYCETGLYYRRTGAPDGMVRLMVRRNHYVEWPGGVAFMTLMGEALASCFLGTSHPLFVTAARFHLDVEGPASSEDEVKGWKATMVLRNAKGQALYTVPHQERQAFFYNDSGRGAVYFFFWGSYLNGPLPSKDILPALAAATTIEFRVSRYGKEEVYRIEASKYPDLW